jgi:hypothetical protein
MLMAMIAANFCVLARRSAAGGRPSGHPVNRVPRVAISLRYFVPALAAWSRKSKAEAYPDRRDLMESFLDVERVDPATPD